MEPLAQISMNQATKNIMALVVNKSTTANSKITAKVKDWAIISTATIFFFCTVFFSIKTGGH